MILTARVERIAVAEGLGVLFEALRSGCGQHRAPRPVPSATAHLEYRESAGQGREKAEAHSVTRFAKLASCGRAYGTSCHHEHACVRCALLRPDPNQIKRLQEITVNLQERVTEATEQGRLGEVDGLQISLTGAEHKLRQMNERAYDPVALGLPQLGQTEPAGAVR